MKEADTKIGTSSSALNLVENARRETELTWSPLRRGMARIVESHIYDVIMGVLILVNSVVIVLETDSRASGGGEVEWLLDVSLAFLVIYAVDVAVRFWVYRLRFFDSKYNILDAAVVGVDLLGIFISTVFDGPSFSFFRVFRICRLFRFVHFLFLFRELHMMLTGFFSAMKAIFWASFMIAIMVTLWSIIAVEVLHPVNQRLTERGFHEGCERCPRAFSTVMHSNLTFLQQIIAGDSWGQVSVPIIEEEPLTVILFFAVLVTINLGLLNLILTVIVDAATDAREQDESRKLSEKNQEFEAAKAKLLKYCAELDDDGSGELTLEELMQGMDDHPPFAQTMALLDVNKEDMNIIYNMLDEDHSGTVTYKEFVEQLHKMKSQDTHTTLIFIKGYLNEVRLKMSEQLTVMKDDLGGATKRLLSGFHTLLYGEELEEEASAQPLEVLIENATGVRNADWMGKSDPYCVCQIKGKPGSMIQTPVSNNSLEPFWNFDAELDGFAKGDSLVFTLFDKNPSSADDLLGRAELTAATLKNKPVYHGHLHIDLDGQARGTLRVKVKDPYHASRPVAGMTTDSKDQRKKLTSLVGIAEDLAMLGKKVDVELAQVLQEVTTKSSSWAGSFAKHNFHLPRPVVPPSLDEANLRLQEQQMKMKRLNNSPCCNFSKGPETTQRVSTAAAFENSLQARRFVAQAP